MAGVWWADLASSELEAGRAAVERLVDHVARPTWGVPVAAAVQVHNRRIIWIEFSSLRFFYRKQLFAHRGDDGLHGIIGDSFAVRDCPYHPGPAHYCVGSGLVLRAVHDGSHGATQAVEAKAAVFEFHLGKQFVNSRRLLSIGRSRAIAPRFQLILSGEEPVHQFPDGRPGLLV